MSKNEFICDCNIIHQDVVNSVLAQMPDKELFSKLAEFFKILGDNTRTKILFALDKNEMCVCDIANVLGMSKCRKDGKEAYYTLDDEHIKQLFEVGMEHIEHKEKI